MKLKNNIAISESGFIFNPTTGDSFEVNSIGKSILEFLKNEKTEKEIIEYIILEYNITNIFAERYIIEFLKDVKEGGFLE